VPVGNVVWFGVRLSNDRTILLYPSHRPGQRRRPGQCLNK
jgi:hypothetical protein